MKETYLYKKLKGDAVKCQNCPHHCVIEEGKRGICGVKKNRGGKLYSLVYGNLCSVNIDPIEKKPLFHFLPGSQSLSIATVGCPLSCHSCQNWQISQGPKLTGKIEGEEFSPKQIIKKAKQYKTPSISYTYTDPVAFSDFALDTMKLAKKEGIKNIWVSSGFWSKELFKMISPYLDAVNVDLKSFDNEFYQKYCGGKLKPVLDTLKRLKNKDIWTEITILVIPNLNDSQEELKKIADFIKGELGTETPWHISRFSGTISWKLQDLLQTPIKTLTKAHQIGKDAGLKYVYVGNVPGTKLEDTFCPKCGAKMIDRTGYSVTRYDEKGKCLQCGTSLNIIK